MVWVRAGAGGIGKSAVTSAAFVPSPSSMAETDSATLPVPLAALRAGISPGTSGARMLGRVAESSSSADASGGATSGAPQLGHAVVDPGANGVRRPQRVHAISCIELLQRK